MRSIKLVPALTATAMLFALASAGASALPGGHKHATHKHAALHKQARPSGNCRITIQAEPRLITVGETATIFGQLKCPSPASASAQAVTLYERSAPAGAYGIVGSATTDTSGAYSLTPPVFKTNSVFYATSGTVHSGHRTVRVAVQVTPTAPTPPDGAQLFTGAGPVKGVSHALTKLSNRVTFAGTVNPVDAGAIVALQRENATANEEWRRIGLGVVNKDGGYSITHTFVVPGDANIRVVVHPRPPLNAPGASTPVSYEISQAQNPNLTIGVAPLTDPIAYGQSVTISGTVAGAPTGTPVTLLARPKAGKLAPVAKTATVAGGGYTFTQAPLQSTFYKATSGATSSAVLFEGVRYKLTLNAPATTVQAGQPLTVTGTVEPARAGHAVYLERQGPNKLGYHVADVGTVTAAGTFSVTHTFFGVTPGATLRVKVPGDPANQGVASTAFTIPITPAPASVLRPQAPGRLPHEGQI